MVSICPDIVVILAKRRSWRWSSTIKKMIRLRRLLSVLIRILASWRAEPLDEILIPMAPDLRCFLPDRTSRLSALHQPQIRNAIWKLTEKTKLTWSRTVLFSSLKRRNEYRNFLKGGSVSVADCSSDELTRIFLSVISVSFRQYVILLSLITLPPYESTASPSV